ncbi:MAG: hypothetical protein L3J12_10095, partial [Spirochaetales bacterium]|nr:hypothetical protein [Spirochaetales bacterium]
ESELSANRYCIENGINKNSFRYWIDRDRDRGKIKTKNERLPEQQTYLRPGKKFVKLNLQKPVLVNESKNISLKYGSFEIEIPTAFKKQDLENLLEVLKSRITCS